MTYLKFVKHGYYWEYPNIRIQCLKVNKGVLFPKIDIQISQTINTIPEESTNLLLIKSRNIAFFVEKLTLEIWPQTFNCRPSSLKSNSKSSLKQKYIHDWLN